MLSPLLGDEALKVEQASVVDGGGKRTVAALDVDAHGVVGDVDLNG